MAVAFGSPLVTGITHLANQLPNYVGSAEQGRADRHLVSKYHIQNWVKRNSPKLVSYARCSASLR